MGGAELHACADATSGWTIRRPGSLRSAGRGREGRTSHVYLGGVGDLAVPRRVSELHSAASEVAGCVPLVYIADRGAAVRLLSSRGDLSLQLFPIGLHLLRGELHPRG